MYLRVNEHGRTFLAGKEYSADQYEQFLLRFNEYMENNGHLPSLRTIAKDLRISVRTASKVLGLHEGSQVLDATKRHKLSSNSSKQCDYGSRTLNEEEQVFLLTLYKQDHTMCLYEYQHELYEKYGKKVSLSTLSRWFAYRFRYRSSVKKSSVFPKEKDSTFNIYRLHHYINFISGIHPCRLIFIDEKPVRGRELYERRSRKCPITGETPQVRAFMPLKNTFNLMAGIRIGHNDRDCLFYQLGKFAGTSAIFRQFVLNMVKTNFVSTGDVIVCDNASMHKNAECRYLRETLWVQAGIMIVYLPAYTPELNPIELMFNVFSMRLRHTNARKVSFSNKSDKTFLHICVNILSLISKKDIIGMFKHCGYIKN